MMSKKKKMLLASACLSLFVCVAGRAEIIRWGTTGQYLYGSDGTTHLPGNRDRNTTDTGLLQLLHLGDNGVYDSPDLLDPGVNGNGAHGDDEVIAQSWVGEGNPVFASDLAGQFTASDRPDATIFESGVDSFLIRIFDTAVSNEDWSAGNIPTTGSHNYALFEQPEKGGGDNDYVLNISEPLSTTREIVPEPSTLILFAALATVLAIRRKRRC